MTKTTKSNLRKSAAMLLLATFSISNIGIATPIEISTPSELRIQSLASKIEIPESYGTIAERFLPSQNTVSTVIHIQDAHTSLEAQEHIRQTLHYLKDQYHLDFILQEGGIGELHGEKLQAFPKESWNQELAEFLLKRGVVSGSERFLLDEAELSSRLDNPQTAKACGVEDAGLYQQNLKAYRRVMELKEESREFSDSLQVGILTAGSHVFNPELQKFFKEWASFQNRPEEILRQLETLKKYAGAALQIDFKDPRAQVEWPYLVRVYKLSSLEERMDLKGAIQEHESLKKWISEKKITGSEIDAVRAFDPSNGFQSKLEGGTRALLQSFFQTAQPQGFSFTNYPALSKVWGRMILREELDAGSLFTEISQLTDQILDKLAVSEKEKSLIQIYKDSRLLAKTLKLELTDEEYSQVLQREKRVRPSVLLKSLQSFQVKKIGKSRGPLFDAALNFYKKAKARDQVMFENMLIRMKAEKKSNAIIIAGGFHSEGLLARLKQKGIAYVEIQPRISDVSQTLDYEKAMLLEGLPKTKTSTTAFPKPLTDASASALPDYMTYAQRIFLDGKTFVMAVHPQAVPIGRFAPRSESKLQSSARAESRKIGKIEDIATPAEVLLYFLKNAKARTVKIRNANRKTGDVSFLAGTAVEVLSRVQRDIWSSKPYSKEELNDAFDFHGFDSFVSLIISAIRHHSINVYNELPPRKRKTITAERIELASRRLLRREFEDFMNNPQAQSSFLLKTLRNQVEEDPLTELFHLDRNLLLLMALSRVIEVGFDDDFFDVERSEARGVGFQKIDEFLATDPVLPDKQVRASKYYGSTEPLTIDYDQRTASAIEDLSRQNLSFRLELKHIEKAHYRIEPVRIPKVMIADKLAKMDGIDRLETEGRIQIARRDLIGTGKTNPAGLVTAIQEEQPDVLMIRSDSEVNETVLQVLSHSSSMRPPLVLRVGADTNNVALKDAEALGVIVARTHGNQNSVANLALRFMFAYLNKIYPEAFRQDTDFSQTPQIKEILNVDPQQFTKAVQESFKKGRGFLPEFQQNELFHDRAFSDTPAGALQNAKIAFVGYGVIPKLIAEKMAYLAAVLKIPVPEMMIWTRSFEAASPGAKEKMLKTANIISLHLPGNAKTYLDAPSLQILSARTDGPIAIINTARLKNVDHEAFLTALETKKDLYYYADIDLTKDGNDIESLRILRRQFPDRVFLVPHIAASTEDAGIQTEQNTLASLEEIASVFSGKTAYSDAKLDFVVKPRSESRKAEDLDAVQQMSRDLLALSQDQLEKEIEKLISSRWLGDPGQVIRRQTTAAVLSQFLKDTANLESRYKPIRDLIRGAFETRYKSSEYDSLTLRIIAGAINEQFRDLNLLKISLTRLSEVLKRVNLSTDLKSHTFKQYQSAAQALIRSISFLILKNSSETQAAAKVIRPIVVNYKLSESTRYMAWLALKQMGTSVKDLSLNVLSKAFAELMPLDHPIVRAVDSINAVRVIKTGKIGVSSPGPIELNPGLTAVTDLAAIGASSFLADVANDRRLATLVKEMGDELAADAMRGVLDAILELRAEVVFGEGAGEEFDNVRTLNVGDKVGGAHHHLDYYAIDRVDADIAVDPVELTEGLAKQDVDGSTALLLVSSAKSLHKVVSDHYVWVIYGPSGANLKAVDSSKISIEDAAQYEALEKTVVENVKEIIRAKGTNTNPVTVGSLFRDRHQSLIKAYIDAGVQAAYPADIEAWIHARSTYSGEWIESKNEGRWDFNEYWDFLKRIIKQNGTYGISGIEAKYNQMKLFNDGTVSTVRAVGHGILDVMIGSSKYAETLAQTAMASSYGISFDSVLDGKNVAKQLVQKSDNAVHLTSIKQDVWDPSVKGVKFDPETGLVTVQHETIGASGTTLAYEIVYRTILTPKPESLSAKIAALIFFANGLSDAKHLFDQARHEIERLSSDISMGQSLRKLLEAEELLVDAKAQKADDPLGAAAYLLHDALADQPNDPFGLMKPLLSEVISLLKREQMTLANEIKTDAALHRASETLRPRRIDAIRAILDRVDLSSATAEGIISEMTRSESRAVNLSGGEPETPKHILPDGTVVTFGTERLRGANRYSFIMTVSNQRRPREAAVSYALETSSRERKEALDNLKLVEQELDRQISHRVEGDFESTHFLQTFQKFWLDRVMIQTGAQWRTLENRSEAREDAVSILVPPGVRGISLESILLSNQQFLFDHDIDLSRPHWRDEISVLGIPFGGKNIETLEGTLAIKLTTLEDNQTIGVRKVPARQPRVTDERLALLRATEFTRAVSHRVIDQEFAENFSSHVHTLSALGRPLSGKGTVMARLLRELNHFLPEEKQYKKLVVGDVFRGISQIVSYEEKYKNGVPNPETLTDTQRKEKEKYNRAKSRYEHLVRLVPASALDFMKQGRLVPTPEALKVLEAILKTDEYKNGRIFYDGWPRNNEQLKHADIDLYFILDVDPDTIRMRTQQRVEEAIANDEEPREDDLPATVNRRLQEYEEQTKPVVEAKRFDREHTFAINGNIPNVSVEKSKELVWQTFLHGVDQFLNFQRSEARSSNAKGKFSIADVIQLIEDSSMGPEQGRDQILTLLQQALAAQSAGNRDVIAGLVGEAWDLFPRQGIFLGSIVQVKEALKNLAQQYEIPDKPKKPGPKPKGETKKPRSEARVALVSSWPEFEAAVSSLQKTVRQPLKGISFFEIDGKRSNTLGYYAASSELAAHLKRVLTKEPFKIGTKEGQWPLALSLQLIHEPGVDILRISRVTFLPPARKVQDFGVWKIGDYEVSEFGAAVIKGPEIWQSKNGEEVRQDNGLATGGGIPLMIPGNGRTVNGVMLDLDGKEHSILDSALTRKDGTGQHALHGFTDKVKWTAVAASENSVTFTISSSDIELNVPEAKTLADILGKVEWRQTYTVDNGALQSQLETINKDNRRIVLGGGYHPFYQLENLQDWTIQFKARKIWADNAIPLELNAQPRNMIDAEDYNTPKPLSYGLELTLGDLQPETDGNIHILLSNTKTGEAKKIVFPEKDFPYLLLWVPPADKAPAPGVFSVEPLFSIPNGRNIFLKGNETAKPLVLEAGQTHVASWTVYPKEIARAESRKISAKEFYTDAAKAGLTYWIADGKIHGEIEQFLRATVKGFGVFGDQEKLSPEERGVVSKLLKSKNLAEQDKNRTERIAYLKAIQMLVEKEHSYKLKYQYATLHPQLAGNAPQITVVKNEEAVSATPVLQTETAGITPEEIVSELLKLEVPQTPHGFFPGATVDVIFYPNGQLALLDSFSGTPVAYFYQQLLVTTIGSQNLIHVLQSQKKTITVRLYPGVRDLAAVAYGIQAALSGELTTLDDRLQPFGLKFEGATANSIPTYTDLWISNARARSESREEFELQSGGFLVIQSGTKNYGTASKREDQLLQLVLKTLREAEPGSFHVIAFAPDKNLLKSQQIRWLPLPVDSKNYSEELLAELFQVIEKSALEQFDVTNGIYRLKQEKLNSLTAILGGRISGKVLLITPAKSIENPLQAPGTLEHIRLPTSAPLKTKLRTANPSTLRQPAGLQPVHEGQRSESRVLTPGIEAVYRDVAEKTLPIIWSKQQVDSALKLLTDSKRLVTSVGRQRLRRLVDSNLAEYKNLATPAETDKPVHLVLPVDVSTPVRNLKLLVAALSDKGDTIHILLQGDGVTQEQAEDYEARLHQEIAGLGLGDQLSQIQVIAAGSPQDLLRQSRRFVGDQSQTGERGIADQDSKFLDQVGQIANGLRLLIPSEIKEETAVALLAMAFLRDDAKEPTPGIMSVKAWMEKKGINAGSLSERVRMAALALEHITSAA